MIRAGIPIRRGSILTRYADSECAGYEFEVDDAFLQAARDAAGLEAW
jgi:hypothetical protein